MPVVHQAILEVILDRHMRSNAGMTALTTVKQTLTRILLPSTGEPLWLETRNKKSMSHLAASDAPFHIRAFSTRF